MSDWSWWEYFYVFFETPRGKCRKKGVEVVVTNLFMNGKLFVIKNAFTLIAEKKNKRIFHCLCDNLNKKLEKIHKIFWDEEKPLRETFLLEFNYAKSINWGHRNGKKKTFRRHFPANFLQTMLQISSEKPKGDEKLGGERTTTENYTNFSFLYQRALLLRNRN